MRDTVAIYRFSLIGLYIAFVSLIVEAVGVVVTSIALAASLDGIWFLIILSDIPLVLCIFLTKFFIELTKGAISEHQAIAKRTQDLNSQVLNLQKQVEVLEKRVKVDQPIEPEVEEVKEEKKETVWEPSKPKKELDISQETKLTSKDVTVSNEKIAIAGKVYEIKDISKLSVSGRNIRFVLGGTKYDIECPDNSEAMKLYNDIYFYL